jgi:hypothetical protein
MHWCRQPLQVQQCVTSSVVPPLPAWCWCGKLCVFSVESCTAGFPHPCLLSYKYSPAYSLEVTTRVAVYVHTVHTACTICMVYICLYKLYLYGFIRYSMHYIYIYDPYHFYALRFRVYFSKVDRRVVFIRGLQGCARIQFLTFNWPSLVGVLIWRFWGPKKYVI